MHIKVLNKTEFEWSKRLWHDCFGDSPEFIDWYYRTRTKPEYVLGAFDGDRLVSMVHMIPMPMRLGGVIRRVSFVSGVCTSKAYRRRGICSEVFERAFSIMEERGFCATVLQPFSPAFYERLGYKTFILRQKITLSYDRTETDGEAEINSYDRTNNAVRPYDEPLLAGLYSDFMKDHDGASLRDPEYFRGFLEEFSSSEARLVITDDGCCAGYAEEGGELFRAYELFFRPGADVLKLLPPGFSRYEFPLPNGFPVPEGCRQEAEEFSMIRPVGSFRLPEFINAYGFDRY